MPGEVVVDASVAAKLYFVEPGTPEAIVELGGEVSLLAPDLLFIEMASIAAKVLRRGETSADQAAAAVASVAALLDEAVPVADLAQRAFEMASQYGFSAYDASYLALAEQRGLRVLTADARLVRRAQDQGLAHLVRLLSP
jgi:predicted nucleic acid-binding protein